MHEKRKDPSQGSLGAFRQGRSRPAAARVSGANVLPGMAQAATARKKPAKAGRRPRDRPSCQSIANRSTGLTQDTTAVAGARFQRMRDHGRARWLWSGTSRGVRSVIGVAS